MQLIVNTDGNVVCVYSDHQDVLSMYPAGYSNVFVADDVNPWDEEGNFRPLSDFTEDPSRALANSDRAAIRIIDDIVEALETEGVLSREKLPQAARAKLSRRAALRDKM